MIFLSDLGSVKNSNNRKSCYTEFHIPIPAFYFDYILNENICQIKAERLIGGYAPLTININTSKNVSFGDHKIGLILSYSDGKKAYQNIQEAKFHINSWSEQKSNLSIFLESLQNDNWILINETWVLIFLTIIFGIISIIGIGKQLIDIKNFLLDHFKLMMKNIKKILKTILIRIREYINHFELRGVL